MKTITSKNYAFTTEFINNYRKTISKDDVLNYCVNIEHNHLATILKTENVFNKYAFYIAYTEMLKKAFNTKTITFENDVQYCNTKATNDNTVSIVTVYSNSAVNHRIMHLYIKTNFACDVVISQKNNFNKRFSDFIDNTDIIDVKHNKVCFTEKQCSFKANTLDELFILLKAVLTLYENN